MRRSFAEDVRLALLEEDADSFEKRLESAVASVAHEIKAMRNSQRYIAGIGVAILLSIISALAAVAIK